VDLRLKRIVAHPSMLVFVLCLTGRVSAATVVYDLSGTIPSYSSNTNIVTRPFHVRFTIDSSVPRLPGFPTTVAFDGTLDCPEPGLCSLGIGVLGFERWNTDQEAFQHDRYVDDVLPDGSLSFQPARAGDFLFVASGRDSPVYFGYPLGTFGDFLTLRAPLTTVPLAVAREAAFDAIGPNLRIYDPRAQVEFTPETVPEPASSYLLVTGAIGLLMGEVRRRLQGQTPFLRCFFRSSPPIAWVGCCRTSRRSCGSRPLTDDASIDPSWRTGAV
jgi:hypothetical protein